MKKEVKKLLVLALCLCLIVSTAACGQKKVSEVSPLSAETSHEEKKQDDQAREEAVKNLEKMQDTSDRVKDISMELFKALYLIFSPSASVKAFISSLYISFTSFSKAFL